MDFVLHLELDCFVADGAAVAEAVTVVAVVAAVIDISSASIVVEPKKEPESEARERREAHSEGERGKQFYLTPKKDKWVG